MMHPQSRTIQITGRRFEPCA